MLYPPGNVIAIGKSSGLVNDNFERFGEPSKPYKSKLFDKIAITFDFHSVTRIHMA